MTEFYEFAMKNAMLFSAWAMVAILLLIIQLKHMAAAPKSLTSQMLTNLVNRENALVVDIRGQGDFNKGHIQGALNVPLSKIKENPSDLEKHQGKPIIVVCANGMQANGACDALKKAEVASLYKLSGGMTSWIGDNLPVVKS